MHLGYHTIERPGCEVFFLYTFLFYKTFLIDPDNTGNLSYNRHSFHDADGIVEVSLGHKIGDDHDLGNAVVAALLYHLGDADIIVAQDSGDIGQCAGTVLHL